MAINKTFVEHTILKASDLNELVTQVNGYIAEINAALQAAIASSTSGIERQTTQSEEDALVFTTDGGTEVGKIDFTGADFANLKRGGQQVARISDLPTKDTSIGDSPSTTHVPTTKAVKDYVDETIGDLPFAEEAAQSGDEEMLFSNDAGSQNYAKVGSYGIKSKAYLDMSGNNVIPVKDTSIGATPSQTNVPTSAAVADYVASHGGGDLPISRETVQSGDEEVVYGNNAMTANYAKIGPYGIKAKAYLDLEGNPIGTGPTIYIGSTRQYTTLRAGIAAAVTKPNTKVIVDSEEFDLTQEFATELASTLTTGVGIKLGNGVHVIFRAGAKVKAILPNNREDVCHFFEPFGVMLTGGGFTLENLDIEAKNTRYCVHDEFGGRDVYVNNRYINCKMVLDNSEAPIKYYSMCIGGGCGKHTYVEIRNCYFDNPYAEDTRRVLVGYHNSGSKNFDYGAGAQSNIFISNSYFARHGTARCTWYGVSTLMSKMVVNNCSFIEPPFCQAETQDYDVENMELIAYNNEIRS